MPQLDVCPRGHGLWLGAAEINFFVEDYRALKAAVAHGSHRAGGVAVRATPTVCPRCSGFLDSESVSDASLMVCRPCNGWWLPRGSLTRLNETHRGSGVAIRLNEPEFYTRAAARSSAARPQEMSRPGPHRREAHPQGWWIWGVLLGFGLVMAALILSKGIQKTLSTAHWAKQPDELLFYLALGLVGGIALFGYGFVLNRRKHLVESIPTSPVRSLAVGLVEVTGMAEADGSPVSAPFSRTPCVFFSFTVQERRGSGRNTRWVTIAKGTSEQPFFVRDQTGAVLVVPLDAELIVADDCTYRNDWLGSLPPEAIAGLNRLGLSTDGWLGDRTLRCTEAFIKPDEPVYVLGTAHENPMGSDGFENAERLYIGSHRDELFIISDRSEKELLAHLGWQVLAMLYAGPALTVACLAAILTLYVTTGP